MSIFGPRKPRTPEPVKVAWASNQSEAEMIESMLNAEGIPCLLRRARGFDVADFLAAGPREILVPALAEEKARDILASLEDDGNTVLPGDEPGEAAYFPD
jgi:hypothetical protein